MWRLITAVPYIYTTQLYTRHHKRIRLRFRNNTIKTPLKNANAITIEWSFLLYNYVTLEQIEKRAYNLYKMAILKTSS